MSLITSKTNLALTLQENLLKAGARTTVSFLNKGEADRAVSLTGRELHDLALRKASFILDKTGALAEKERPVILAMTAGLDLITTLFGCIYAGITVVTVPVSKTRIALDRLSGIIHDCGAIDILVDKSGANTFQSLSIQEESHDLNVVSIPENDEIVTGDLPLADLPGFLKAESDNAYIQYTSGSSKAPKGVVLTDKNVLHNSHSVGTLLGYDESTVMGNWLPHYHDMGLMGGLLYPVLNGGTLVFMSSMAFAQKPLRWLRMISAFGVTATGAPPFAFGLCLNHKNEEELEGLDLSCLKVAYCGAETVFRKVLNDFRDKFRPMGLDPSAICACYGMAEITVFAGGQVNYDPDRQDPMSESLIEPCVFSDEMLETFRIVDPKSRELLEDGERGEIWLQSDSLGKGYLDGKKGLPLQYITSAFQNTHAQLDGEWFNTGDLAIKHGNHLYIQGRIKDTIIVNGQNVAAADIEWYAGEVHEELNGLGAAAFTAYGDPEGSAHLLIESKKPRVKGVDFQEVEGLIRSRVRSLFSVELNEVLILKRGTLDRTSSGKVRRLQIARNFHKSLYASSVLN